MVGLSIQIKGDARYVLSLMWEYLELESSDFEHALDGDMRENELLTVKEVAAFLRVSRVTVWRWCQQGIIPASRLGRNWRIRRDALLELLESSECLPPANSNQHDGSTQENSPEIQTKGTVASKNEENIQTKDEAQGETSDSNIKQS